MSKNWSFYCSFVIRNLTLKFYTHIKYDWKNIYIYSNFLNFICLCVWYYTTNLDEQHTISYSSVGFQPYRLAEVRCAPRDRGQWTRGPRPGSLRLTVAGAAAGCHAMRHLVVVGWRSRARGRTPRALTRVWWVLFGDLDRRARPRTKNRVAVAPTSGARHCSLWRADRRSDAGTRVVRIQRTAKERHRHETRSVLTVVKRPGAETWSVGSTCDRTRGDPHATPWWCMHLWPDAWCRGPPAAGAGVGGCGRGRSAGETRPRIGCACGSSAARV
jgi:hypothetical protein